MYKKEHFKKEKIHNEKQLTNYRKSELRVDIVNKELAIFTATVDAIVIGAHGQAVDLTIFVFFVHFRWFRGPILIRGFGGRPQQHPTVLATRDEQGTVV